MLKSAVPLRIGDRLPPAPGFSIMVDPEVCPPGARRRRWHALRVVAQRERAVCALLERHGVRVAFFPVDRLVRTVMGRRSERESRFLPGYVFALFPREVVWHRLLATPERPERPVRDVIRLPDGRAAWLAPADVRNLWEMRARQEAAARHWRAARAAKAGGKARIVSGPLGGQVVEVLTLRGANAVVTLRLFSGEVDASVAADMLVAEGV